jgi:putative PIN family toxin of toxin-antitoxin system
MRAVLDTNVVISATLIRGGNEDRILRAWRRGRFDLVLSPPILEELGRALFYEKLQKFRWMSEEEVAALLQALAQGSELVSGRRSIRASRDPDDDKFIAAAIEGEAEYVVTGDHDLLGLDPYEGVRIVTPAAFLTILRRGRRRRTS